MAGPSKKRKRNSYANGSNSNGDRRHALTDNDRTHGPGSVYASIPPSLLSLALTTSHSLPPALQKYWWKRHTLFSLFSSGILLDEQSWYSVTPEPIAHRIATRCSSTTALDAFCGAGGNAIQLALTCERVVAIDIDENKIRLARHNAQIYGVQDRITFCHGDYIDFVHDVQEWRRRKDRRNDGDSGGQGQDRGEEDEQSQRPSKWNDAEKLDIDVVFLSPPWGGVGYLEPASMANTPTTSPSKPTATSAYTDIYPLSLLQPLPGKQLFDLTSTITGDIAFYLPRNSDLDEIANLVPPSAEGEGEGENGVKIKVEEQYLGPKLSAITCYFGRLASDWDDETDTWRTT
ncbi:uncharacterized protein PFL1_04951 [Pseudozyma flocculosa PF-1]|uniref:Trimethylguanosine synthase n=1 Tax=Pseudozyma flocculosa PF-1 TaxID=1277687 RepID=A0A061H4A8_9BASI|nr:uncharacterized protein PFL1_04951 [Pseudozyma flocculosa PF-1]EPQ27413.1 hypothetical protein PFL1_04951 [Pseudozyma flocculosa PF-1]